MKLFFRILAALVGIMIILILLGLLFFAKSDIPLNELKAKYTTEASQFIDIDGIQVHFRDEGSSENQTLVLIHGTGASLHTFDEWANELKQDYRVVRMDLPAYGLTGPFLDGNYSIKQYVTFLDAFLEGINVENLILAGNSLGGEIAWNYTAEHPDKVQKLILIDAAGYPLKPKSVPLAFKLARIPILRSLFTVLTPRSIVKSSVENVYVDDSRITESLVDRYFELSLREGNRKAFIDRLNMQGKKDNTGLIPSIKASTLILWGTDDSLIPLEYAYKFNKDLPNSELTIIPSCGHVPMEECADQSLQAVLEYLGSK